MGKRRNSNRKECIRRDHPASDDLSHFAKAVASQHSWLRQFFEGKAQSTCTGLETDPCPAPSHVSQKRAVRDRLSVAYWRLCSLSWWSNSKVVEFKEFVLLIWRLCLLLEILYVIQARVFTPLMFIAQLPQIPSRQDLRKARVASWSAFMCIRRSSTIVPHLFKSMANWCRWGFSFGFSGFHLYTLTIFNRGFCDISV